MDMNSYFAGVEQQERPELRGRPVGVVPMVAETTCCIAASYEAKLFGVKTGTPVGEARLRCPHVAIVPARPFLYRQTHERIVAAVGKVAPVDQVLSIDEMVVRPWRNERFLWDGLRLGQAVQDAIRYEVGEWLSCSVGLGPNALLAKVASDFQKPRGLSVISYDDIPYKLYHLKLSDWPGIGRQMEKRLNAFGVQTTMDMYDLSMADLKHIWRSVNGERWWRLIRGQAVAMPPIKRSQVGHSNVLAPEFRTPGGAWCIAARLLEKAAERMRLEGYHARCLCLGVSGYEEAGWTRRVRFAPSNRTRHLMGLLESLWDDSVKKPSHVGVALQEILPDKDVICGLFEDEKEVALDRATDGINDRFGRGTVTTAAALSAKGYLDHGRIPFGAPRAVR